MTVSLVLTIHNRTPEVSRLVAQSFCRPGNDVHEVVVVLDRPTEAARRGAIAAWVDDTIFPWSVRLVEVDGPSGWLCPAKAWNAGHTAATGDLIYQISSEVVQDPGNVEKAVSLASDGNTVVFGACHNSTPESLVVGAEPGLLASSKMPRPLGFIACFPREKMMEIGGNDLAFMDGLWYEDDDLFLRLWRAGLDFCFDDSIHGVHLHHDRPDLATPEGQAKIQRNAALMAQKHGTVHPWANTPRLTIPSEGRTWWRHL